MTGKMIYQTGSLEVLLPPTMGEPRPDQLLGTRKEQLTEIACRICYDSLGLKKSRDSEQLHFHIQDAPNLSVYEHATQTIRIPAETDRESLLVIGACMNRKGVTVRPVGRHIHITANLRAALEWDTWSIRNVALTNLIGTMKVTKIGNALKAHFKRMMPMALSRLDVGEFHYYDVPLYEGLDETERFISVWLYGSRGFTHEQVRHRFAMSQRSTRFVDELPPGWFESDNQTLGYEDQNPCLTPEIKCEGEFIVHPLTKKFVSDPNVDVAKRQEFFDRWMALTKVSRGLYKYLVDNLQEYVGGDSTNARKQARGAARLVLPNALASEMIYTASIADWRWIISQRAVDLADAEIRKVVCETLRTIPELMDEYKFEEAKDGLGYVACRI